MFSGKHFFLPPSRNTEALITSIQKNGGEAKRRYGLNTIELVDCLPGTEAPPSHKTNKCFSNSYIMDCIRSNKLLDIKAYQVNRPVIAKKTEEKIKVPRFRYTKEVEIQMTQFASSSILRGLKLWKEFKETYTCQHSIESLKQHWRKMGSSISTVERTSIVILETRRSKRLLHKQQINY